jgi:hypothetical protein
MDEAKPEPPIEQEITADYPIDETDEDEKNSNH